MELIKRIVRVIRANLSNLVNKAEDPEKLLEEAFAQMQANLVQLRQSVAVAIATQKRTERQAEAAQSQSAEWYRRAQLALKQENELLARQALTKRHAYQETATALLNQIQQQKSVVVKLKQDMQQLELKLAEIKTKKEMFIARARSAEATYRLQEMLNELSSPATSSILERMEDKVLQIEAQSELMGQLSNDGLEQRFTELKSYNIDAEIAAMKTQMLEGTSDTQSQTSPPTVNQQIVASFSEQLPENPQP
ncbi:MAG TPA: PspA/IM30 family protein [Nostocaceae cyanobacterium]|nr:PspA/IM30 family protein [Nostocaceae cyanobacterium]